MKEMRRRRRRKKERKGRGGGDGGRAEQLMCTASSDITFLIYILGSCKTFMSDDFCERLESRAYGKTALMCAAERDTDVSAFNCIKVLADCCSRVSG